MRLDVFASIRRRALPALALAFAASLFSGCATGRDYEMGQKAERSGDAHLAYDAYCRAASQNPDNTVIKSAIKRVTPKAADYWEKQGHLAVSQKRYPDAWRSFMRVLEIRPDHPSAAMVVRQLEQEHPTEVAFARQDYEQRGARSLVMSSDGGKATGAPVGGTMQAAQRGSSPDLGMEDDVYVPPGRGRMPPPPPPPTAGKYGAQTGAGTSFAAAPVSAQPSPYNSSTEPMISSPAPMSSTQAPIPYNPPVSSYSQNQPYAPAAPAPIAPAPPRSQFNYTAAPPPPAPSVVTANVGPPAGYMVVRTLSKEDRRYARRREFVDGVAIRLDGVDDYDCDLELYMGGVRVVEINDIRINQSVRFVGQTGRQFLLTVLDIRESTETVRIGVSPQ